MNSLKGIFDNPKPPKKNFILENMKQLRTMKKVSDRVINVDCVPKKVNLYPHVSAKVSTNFSPSYHQKIKGSSNVEMCENGKLSNGSTRVPANSANPLTRRSRPLHLISNQQSLGKSNARKKSSGIRNSVSNVYDKDVYGKANSKLCDMIKNVSTMSLSRSASVLDGSTSQLGQPTRLRSTVSEHQVRTEAVRSLGCQTLPPDDVESILNEGVIKYPSTWSLETQLCEKKTCEKVNRPTTCDSALQTEIPLQAVNTQNMPLPKPRLPRRMVPPNDDVSSCKRLQNIFHSNYTRVFSEDQLDERLKGVAANQKNFSQGHWYGGLNGREKKCRDRGEPQNAIPGYVDDAPGDTADQSCPIGHVPLPDHERVETLRMLRKSYEEHIKELNSLPVKTDTLKMRQRKIDLERHLNKLEEGIKVFSRPKVFVKIGT